MVPKCWCRDQRGKSQQSDSSGDSVRCHSSVRICRLNVLYIDKNDTNNMREFGVNCAVSDAVSVWDHVRMASTKLALRPTEANSVGRLSFARG